VGGWFAGLAVLEGAGSLILPFLWAEWFADLAVLVGGWLELSFPFSNMGKVVVAVGGAA
jgi:hypothetical protein